LGRSKRTAHEVAESAICEARGTFQREEVPLGERRAEIATTSGGEGEKGTRRRAGSGRQRDHSGISKSLKRKVEREQRKFTLGKAPSPRRFGEENRS